jgi:hypothetical protein
MLLPVVVATLDVVCDTEIVSCNEGVVDACGHD